MEERLITWFLPIKKDLQLRFGGTVKILEETDSPFSTYRIKWEGDLVCGIFHGKAEFDYHLSSKEYIFQRYDDLHCNYIAKEIADAINHAAKIKLGKEIPITSIHLPKNFSELSRESILSLLSSKWKVDKFTGVIRLLRGLGRYMYYKTDLSSEPEIVNINIPVYNHLGEHVGNMVFLEKENEVLFSPAENVHLF